MEIQTRKEKVAVVVLVKGRMDAVTAPEFEKNMLDFISKGEKTFVINLVDLDYISSAGLRSILALAKKLKEGD
jgi:anti-anti-sigma factor